VRQWVVDLVSGLIKLLKKELDLNVVKLKKIENNKR
jgi:hypothetical protein